MEIDNRVPHQWRRLSYHHPSISQTSIMPIAETMLAILPTLFLSTHLRRGDYHGHCKRMPQACDLFGEMSFVQNLTLVTSVLKSECERSGIYTIFVATDDHSFMRELNGAQNATTILFLSSESLLKNMYPRLSQRPDQVSFAEQIVAGMAMHFIGNRFSSFSNTIVNYRLQANRTFEYW